MLKINEEVVDLPKDLKGRLKGFKERFDQDRLLRMIEVVSQAREEMKRSEEVRLILEMAIIRLTKLEPTLSLDEVLRKIESIEERLGVMPAQGNLLGAPPKRWEELPIEETVREGLEEEKPYLELENIKDTWGEVIKEIRKDSAVTGAFLMEGEPIALKDDLLTIGFSEDFKFHKEQIEEKENRELIQKALNKVFGREFTIECRLSSTLQKEKETRAPQGMVLSEEEFIEEEPVVKEALDIFEGEILEIKPTGKVIPSGEDKK